MSRRDNTQQDFDASHSSPDRKRERGKKKKRLAWFAWNVSTVSTIYPVFPPGGGGNASRAQLTKRRGPDVVRLSDVTELRVFKGQTELLDKCHRHHIDIGPVFLNAPTAFTLSAVVQCGCRWGRSAALATLLLSGVCLVAE